MTITWNSHEQTCTHAIGNPHNILGNHDEVTNSNNNVCDFTVVIINTALERKVTKSITFLMNFMKISDILFLQVLKILH